MADTKLIFRSLRTLGQAVLWTIPAEALITFLFTSQADLTHELNTEILSRTEPSIINILVAFVAGLAASFALIKPQFNVALPGVAISVALIPSTLLILDQA